MFIAILKLLIASSIIVISGFFLYDIGKMFENQTKRKRSFTQAQLNYRKYKPNALS